MDVLHFRQQHENSWRELESLTQRRRQTLRSPEELNRFAVLYRKVASDLSYAQTHFPSDPITRYLNALVTTAHNRFYRTGNGGFRAVGRFLISGFPALFRECGGYILIATAISLGAALFGYIVTLESPLQAYQLLPANLVNGINPSGAGAANWNAPVISSAIMVNNIQVSLLAFAGGALFGTLTVYSLLQNGLILGVLAAIVQSAHKTALFWSLIVPHGVTELTAIFISGGAGLLFAHRLVSPGPYRRSTAVYHALVKAVQLFLGVVLMLVIAGTIEGFLTPSALPESAKFLFAALTGMLWLLYFGRLGRSYKAPRYNV